MKANRQKWATLDLLFEATASLIGQPCKTLSFLLLTIIYPFAKQKLHAASFHFLSSPPNTNHLMLYK